MLTNLNRATVVVAAIISIAACQKNTAQTSSRNLTGDEKSALVSKVKTDPIFSQWNANQQKVVEAYAKAAQQPGFDMQKIQAKKPKNDHELIDALKEAGAPNAEEILGLNKKSMQLLKDLWQKYPDLEKLSQDELFALKVKNPLNLQQ